MTTEKTRVLVIDDDELVRCGVAYMLDRLGHQALRTPRSTAPARG